MAADRLQLQVILSALDRASAPLRHIQGNAVGAGQALKQAREQLKVLDAQQKDINAWRTQRAAAQDTERALEAARQRVRDLGQAMAASGAPTRRMTGELRAAIRQATALKHKHADNQVQLQGLRNRLAAAGISTRQLGQAERELRGKVTATTQAMAQQQERLKRITHQQRQLATAKGQYERSQALAGRMAGAGAGATAAGAALGAPVLAVAKGYIDFEDAMLGVAKQVDGARDDNGQLTAVYYEMGDAIKALSERVPMATTELAALVEGAARMGIQGQEDLIGFADVASRAAIAFELPAEQIGEDLARIAGLYKLPIKDIDKLGDAINYLDDNAKSKGADIIEVMQRTAGVVANANMTYQDAAALGSTFLSLGAGAEVAATATKAMIRELSNATMQPARFQEGLKTLGLEAKEIQDGMATDATGTIQKVLEAITRLPNTEHSVATTRIFLKEHGGEAAKLANNLAEYRRQLEMANSEAAKGSMAREAEIRAQSLSAQLLMARNRAFNLTATLGESLRPSILRLVEGFNRVIGRLTAWVKANPELAYSVLKVAGGLAILATAFGTLTLGLASLLGPFALFRYALLMLGIRGTGLGHVLLFLGRTALPLVAKAVLLIGRALLLNPIGLAITAIALAALLIYQYWDPIKAYALELWAEIRAGFEGGIGGIVRLILDFSPLGLFYRAFAGVMRYFGTELPGTFTGFGNQLMQGLIDGIRSRFTALKNTIGEIGDGTIAWFKDKLGIHSPSRVFAALGGFTMAGLAQGLAAGEGSVLAQLADTASRLTVAGAGVLQHAFTFDSRPPISAGAAPVTLGGDTYTITINAAPGMDPQAVARAVRQELARHKAQGAARQRSRLTDRE